MAYYIKARPNVARILGLDGLCAKTADGNVLLWQGDLKKTGHPVISDAVAAIGGALLTPSEAKAERDGAASKWLPEPTDPKYIEAGQASAQPQNEETEAGEGDEQ